MLFSCLQATHLPFLLDSTRGEEILNLMDELHREFNTTILMVTHNQEAAAHCDRIIRLRDGRVIREENAKALSAEVR